jgi:hypothetical protein
VDLQRILADACDGLARSEYQRGSQPAIFGKGVSQALLRAILRAYALHCLADQGSRRDASRLRVTRRALLERKSELGLPNLSPEAASNALWEWASLLRQPRTVDVDDEHGIVRVIVTAFRVRSVSVI